MVILQGNRKRANSDVENAVRKAWIASASQSIANVEDNTVVGEIEIFVPPRRKTAKATAR
jgi:hypothetical protein